MKPSLEERFYNRIKVTDSGCHEFIGFKNRHGYGQIGVGSKLKLTHRLAWELAFGLIPDGLWVLHKCDNPPCCNVDHLWLGTQAENVADMIAKGRQGINAQSIKTHCPKGHPYDEVNTYVKPNGSRNCRACRAAQDREYAKTYPERIIKAKKKFREKSRVTNG